MRASLDDRIEANSEKVKVESCEF